MLCGEWALKTWYCTQCNAICNHSMLSLMSLKEIMEDDGFVDFCWYLGRLVKVLCANMEGGDSEYLVKKNILPNCLYSSNAILRRHTKTFSEFQLRTSQLAMCVIFDVIIVLIVSCLLWLSSMWVHWSCYLLLLFMWRKWAPRTAAETGRAVWKHALVRCAVYSHWYWVVAV